jgi:Cu-processing system permease protein
MIALIARKEVFDALRNRWFMLYAAAFALLALALARLSLAGDLVGGFAGFGRTAGSLVNLVLLIVPLMGLTLGATSLAAERERGTLATLLAQPVTRLEVLLGKYLGLALALVAALGLGFGLAGGILAIEGGTVKLSAYAGLVGFAVVLALAMLSLGFLISAATRRAGAATGVALFTWLAFVFFGDLGLMSTAVMLRLDVGTLFTLVLLNPLETFKIAAVAAITGALDVLGPAGVYAARTYGDRLVGVLLGVLAVWTVVPLMAAQWLFQRRGIL